MDYSRDRNMAGAQGDAYHPPQSPGQTPSSTGRLPRQSPDTSAPLPPQLANPNANPHPTAHQHHHQHSTPAHHAHHQHALPHHRSPVTPAAPELPSIGAALYSRDRNAYYDPTQDHGHAARDAAPTPTHYPPQVRPLAAAAAAAMAVSD